MHITIIFNHGGLIICHSTSNVSILGSPNERNKSRWLKIDMNTAVLFSFSFNARKTKQEYKEDKFATAWSQFSGSSAEISFREGERWAGDTTAAGSHERQCMLLAKCSPTAPKHRLAGWRSRLPSNYISHIQRVKKRIYIPSVCVGIIILKFCFVHQQHSSGPSSVNRICICLMMSALMISDICESSQLGNGLFKAQQIKCQTNKQNQ